jgi:hypothetical protein
MGTETVLKDTLLDIANLKYHLLQEKNDIDTYDDIKNVPFLINIQTNDTRNFNYNGTIFKRKGFNNPQIGMYLGTGLGQLVDHLEVEVAINYTDIPNFPVLL